LPRIWEILDSGTSIWKCSLQTGLSRLTDLGWRIRRNLSLFDGLPSSAGFAVALDDALQRPVSPEDALQ